MSEEEKVKTNIIVSIIFIFIAIIGCVLAFIYIDKIKSFKIFGNKSENKEKVINIEENKNNPKELITAYEYLDILKSEVTSHSKEYNMGKYTKYIYYDSLSKNLLLTDERESEFTYISSVKCDNKDCEVITPKDIKEGNHVFNVLVLVDGENYLILDVNTSKLYIVSNMRVSEYNDIKYVNRNVYYNIETKGIVFSSNEKLKYYSTSLNDIVNEFNASYDEDDSYNYDKYVVIKYNGCISSLLDLSTGEETKKIKGYYTSPSNSEEKNKYGINTKLFYSDCDKKFINILDDSYNPVFDQFYDNLKYDLETNTYFVYNSENKIVKTYNLNTKKIEVK